MHKINTKYKLNTFTLSKLNILYLNINSIRNKIDEIEIIIASHSNKIIHFMALTEIRITRETNKFYHIPNYNVYFNNRDSGDGGVALYIHDSIQTTEIHNECIQNINFLMIRINKLKFNLGVIYKKPTVTNNTFNEFMRNKLSRNKKTIIIGDTNINLLKQNTNTEYTQLIESNGYKILNKIDTEYATRIKKQINKIETRTIIDHIITDIHNFNYTININNTELSDHKQILVNIDCNDSNIETKTNFTNNKIEINKTIVDQYKFENILENYDLSNVNSFEELHNTILNIKQKSTKTIKYTKIINPFKPWVDKVLLKLINERNRYFKLIKKCPKNEYLKQQYKQLSDQIKINRKLKRNEYNENKINTNIQNPKKKCGRH